MSEIFTGMIIGYEQITNRLTKIYLDTLSNKKTKSFTYNIPFEKFKIGDYIVVHINPHKKEVNVKLLTELI